MTIDSPDIFIVFDDNVFVVLDVSGDKEKIIIPFSSESNIQQLYVFSPKHVVHQYTKQFNIFFY